MADTARSNGIWITLVDPRALTAVASGFDWLCVDEQHGYASAADTALLLGAATAAGATALVRVAWNRPELIGRALDSGAAGVIVPMVESAADAAAAVRAARYAPHGRRSFGPLRGPWGTMPADVDEAEKQTRCLVMVESPEALADIEAIAAVPGLDGIFVGPFDLSLSLGLDVDDMVADTASDAPLSRIVDACNRHRVTAAAFAGSVDRAEVLAARGFSMLAVTSDDGLLTDAAAALADRLR